MKDLLKEVILKECSGLLGGHISYYPNYLPGDPFFYLLKGFSFHMYFKGERVWWETRNLELLFQIIELQ